MKNIDFLPPRYRERHQRRWAFAWEVAVVAFFSALIAVAVLWQVNQRWRVGQQLAAIENEYQQAIEMGKTQQHLQARLAVASEGAELYLYLQHPWPRTQVLRAIETCLPEDMLLTGVQLTHEAIAPPPAPEDGEFAKLSPLRRDLAQLRRQADNRVAVLKIAGTTDDASQIYHFAHRLGELPPLASLKLESAENQGDKSLRQTGFRLHGILKPGYYQPGGPEHTLAEARP